MGEWWAAGWEDRTEPANWDRVRKSVQRSVTWIGHGYWITSVPWHSHPPPCRAASSSSSSCWLRNTDGYGNGRISNRNSIPGGLQWFVVARGQVYKFNLSAMPQCCCFPDGASGCKHHFIGLATVNPRNNAAKLAERAKGVDYSIPSKLDSVIPRASYKRRTYLVHK